MLSKRLIACLDVWNGNLAKSVKFVNTREIGDAVEAARRYYLGGIDEIVLYDITASHEKRDIMIELVERVAAEVFIPFSVGGGLKNIGNVREVLLAGAEKVNFNTAAVENPSIISDVSSMTGTQCVVLSMDVKKVKPSQSIPSGYEIVVNGGRTPKGLDAIWWAKEGMRRGAGEIVVNSIDADGTREGYEIELTRTVAKAVGIPVIASGGGGKPQHLYEVLTKGEADAALAASILHYGEYSITELKQYLHKKGLQIRMNW